MIKPHKLLEVGRTIASQIVPIERSIDDGIAKTARLLASLPDASRAANLPACTGHEGLVRVVATINAMATARGEMIAAHDAFAATRDMLRLPAQAFGSPEGCPPAALSLVDTAAA